MVGDYEAESDCPLDVFEDDAQARTSTSSTASTKVKQRSVKTGMLSHGDLGRRDLTNSFEEARDEEDELMSDEVHQREHPRQPEPEHQAEPSPATKEAQATDFWGRMRMSDERFGKQGRHPHTN